MSAGRFIFSLLLLFCALTETRAELVLLTTSTIENSGLLAYLLQHYRSHREDNKTYQSVKAVVTTSGQVFDSVRRGNGDLILTHDLVGESELMQDGWLVHSYEFIHSEFWLVGPDTDPAQARATANLRAAFAQIHSSQQNFLARGDLSGTSAREQQIWQTLAINPQNNPKYKQNGQGMGATLRMAYELKSYTLSDSATWLSYPSALKPALIQQKASDSLGKNQYSLAITRNADAGSSVFLEWLCGRGLRLLPHLRSIDGQTKFHSSNCIPRWPK